MPHPRSMPLILALWYWALSSGIACVSTAVRQHKQDVVAEVPERMDVGSTATVYPGPLDVTNQYRSTVLFEGSNGRCSGVLMTADRVLTAGHCVCAKRKVSSSDRKKLKDRRRQAFPQESAGGREKLLTTVEMINDGSQCSGSLAVFVVNHAEPPEETTGTLYLATTVHPHPHFLMLEDAQGKAVYNEADLAILQLSSAVGEHIRPIQLPSAEVRPKQNILLVGHGPGKTHWPEKRWGFRHVGKSRVTTLERHPSGSTRIAASSPEHGTRVFGGDSGGGGFLQDDDTVLVGIISATSEKHGAILESVHAQLKWLEAEGLGTPHSSQASPP